MKWFLSIAVIIWWAGLASDEKVIELLGLKVAKIKLFPVAGAFFVLMNLVFWLYLKRISAIFKLADEKDQSAVLAALATHPWILNPFALYNVKKSGGVSYVNVSLLVLVWWFCNLSLCAIYPYFSLSTVLGSPWLGFVLVFFPS
jgi:hypothetical protein